MVNLNKKWIDSHAHLDEVPCEELDEVCANLVSVLNVGTDIASSQRALAQALQWHGSMFVAAGISIPEVDRAFLNWEKELEELLKHPLVVAVGETGVDGANRNYPSLHRQREVFKQHLALAVSHDKPVIVHSRGAEEEALEMCQAAGAKRVLFHCYTGEASLIESIMEAGYYVSLSGIVTFKNGPLREVAQTIWPSRLLIETDSPYLAPEPMRGRVNTPRYVSYVGERVAALRGEDEELLAELIQNNFKTLFRVSL